MAAGGLLGFAFAAPPAPLLHGALFGAGLGLCLPWLPSPQTPGILYLGGLFGLAGWTTAFLPFPWGGHLLPLLFGGACAFLARSALGEAPGPSKGPTPGWGALGISCGLALSLASPGVYLWLGGLLFLLLALGFLEERGSSDPQPPEEETPSDPLLSPRRSPFRLAAASALAAALFALLVRSLSLSRPGGAQALLLLCLLALLWTGWARWGLFDALCFRHRAFAGGVALGGGGAFVLAAACPLLAFLGRTHFPFSFPPTLELLLLGLLLGGQGIALLGDRYPRGLMAAGLALGAAALGALSGLVGLPTRALWLGGTGALGLGLGLVLEGTWRTASDVLGPQHRASAFRWYAGVLLCALGGGRLLAPAELHRTSGLFLQQMAQRLGAQAPRDPALLRDLLGHGADLLAAGRCLALLAVLLLLLLPLIRLLPRPR